MELNICQQKTNLEQLKISEEKMLNTNEISIKKIENLNKGGKGTTQERKENFIKKAKRIHNNKYDYSKINYVNSFNKVEIICPIHGSDFQLPSLHLRNGGCRRCGVIIRSSNRASSTEEFIKKAKLVYGNKYDYSKFIYVRSFVKAIIICRKHGEFLQNPNNHLDGIECPICYGTPKKTMEQFITDANKLHNNKYDYSKVNYVHNKQRVIIICKKHGEFQQKPNGHLSGEGCPKCNSSKGETKILNFLQQNNIEFKHQKTFNDCRNPQTHQMLKFDFYIPSKNLLVEYDGEQHFRTGNFGRFQFSKKDLDNIQYRDKIKTNYAKNSDINLLRIKYIDLNKIDNILSIKLPT
jgi:hypothetical protein